MLLFSFQHSSESPLRNRGPVPVPVAVGRCRWRRRPAGPGTPAGRLRDGGRLARCRRPDRNPLNEVELAAARQPATRPPRGRLAGPSRDTRPDAATPRNLFSHSSGPLWRAECTGGVTAFLDWVYERGVAEAGVNPGRTANKAREHLRAVLSWAWEQELIDAPPRFPKPREQRDVAGRHYLTKAEINALYFAPTAITDRKSTRL